VGGIRVVSNGYGNKKGGELGRDKKTKCRYILRTKL
jgi:hypothetical protein